MRYVSLDKAYDLHESEYEIIIEDIEYKSYFLCKKWERDFDIILEISDRYLK